MEAIPEDVQKLADVQAELNNITKEFSETILSDTEGSFKRAKAGAKDFNVLTDKYLQ